MTMQDAEDITNYYDHVWNRKNKKAFFHKMEKKLNRKSKFGDLDRQDVGMR